MIINVTKCHKSSQVLLFSVQTQNSDNMKENGFHFFQFTTMKKGEKQQVQKFHLMNFIDFFRKYMIIVMPSTSAGGFLFGNRWAGASPAASDPVISNTQLFHVHLSSQSASVVWIHDFIPVAFWIPLIPFSSSCGSVCAVPAPLIYPPPFVFHANSIQTIPGLSPRLLNSDYLSPGLLPQLSWAPFPTLLTPAQTPLP